jgi:hypothetical protein
MRIHALIAAATPFTDLPLDMDSAWDGAAAVKAMDTPEALKRGHFWQDTSSGADPASKSSYKLPFVVDGKANWRAVTAAAAALQGGRGGVSIPRADVDGVKNHVARYYKKAGKTPPWESAALIAAAVVDGYEWEAKALTLDKPTDDGRVIDAAGFSWREPPLALMYAPVVAEDHDGAYQVGNLLDVRLEGEDVIVRGNYLASPEAQAFAALVADPENAMSVSVDLAIQKAVQSIDMGEDGALPMLAAEPEGDEPEQGEPEPEPDEEPSVMEVPVIDTETEVLEIQQCKMIGLTALVHPAQDGLSITNLSWVPADEPAEPVTAATSETPDDPDADPPPDPYADPIPNPDPNLAVHDERLEAAIQALRDADLPRQIQALALAVDKGLLTEDEARERLGYERLNGQRVTHDLAAITEQIQQGKDAQSLIAQTLAKLEQREPQVTNIHVPASGARHVRVVKDETGTVTGYEAE